MTADAKRKVIDMSRKLLAMDLDGTAVYDNYKLGMPSRLALEKAKQAGHVVAFVSGRRDIDMLTMDEEDAWCVDYQILNTGGKIIRCADKAVLHNELIPPQVCRKLISHCLENGLQLQICSGLVWQVTIMTEQTLEYARDVGVIPEVIRSLEETDWENGLEGFMATRDWDPVAEYIDQELSEVYYVNSEPGCIDIMPANATKWGGIKQLADDLGIPAEDIITVGNYYNDMDMLEHAGVGIAVANSLEPVKAVADFVTERDNNHDAVEEIVEKILSGDFDISQKERRAKE